MLIWGSFWGLSGIQVLNFMPAVIYMLADILSFHIGGVNKIVTLETSSSFVVNLVFC